jgi:hypothetical protein
MIPLRRISIFALTISSISSSNDSKSSLGSIKGAGIGLGPKN